MRAVVINKFVKDLSDLEISYAPLPEPKDSNNILVKVTHAAVTHVDQLYAQGLHQNNRRHLQPPFILGTELAGIVETAPSSSLLKSGDRVFGGGLGAYAEYVYAAPEGLRKIPSVWSNAEACAVGVSGAISYGALVSVAGLKAGETALILGASGGLGVMAVQIALSHGAKVIAVASSASKAKMLGALGKVKVINYKDSDWEDQVKALTKLGEGVDVVYDSIGAVQSALKCLKYRGRIVIVGFAARGGAIEKVPMNRVLLKSATVLGYRFGEDGRRDPQRTIDVWEGFMKLAEQDGIRPVLYQDKDKEPYSLQTVAQALEAVRSHMAWGRVVLEIEEAAEKAML